MGWPRPEPAKRSHEETMRRRPHWMARPASSEREALPVKPPAKRPPFALARRPAWAPQSLSRRDRLPARSRSGCCGIESSDRVAASEMESAREARRSRQFPIRLSSGAKHFD
jgi:hypothetical protein